MFEFLNQDPSILFAWLFGSIVFSSIGLYFIKEGRRRSHTLWLILGIVLLVYTYFTSNVWLIWILGLALTFLGYKLR